MAKVIDVFFSSLFKSTRPSAQTIRKAMAHISSCLSDTQWTYFGMVFTAAEVKEAAFSLSPTKASGPDGFQAFFFPEVLGLK